MGRVSKDIVGPAVGVVVLLLVADYEAETSDLLEEGWFDERRWWGQMVKYNKAHGEYPAMNHVENRSGSSSF